MTLHMIEPPPEGLGPDDLAKTLLQHMGVAWSQQNMLAASEALRIGTGESRKLPQVYVLIVKRWQEYKASDHYRSQFRRKAAQWLSEGDYDNPASWGGKNDYVRQEQPQRANGGDSVKDWAKDKAAHPEKYPSPAEATAFLNALREIAAKKVMK